MNTKKTLTSCYIAFVTLAIIINIAPLFLVIFTDKFGLSTIQKTLLVTINFLTQIITDFLSLGITKKLGLRKCAVISHTLTAVGLVLFALLPNIMPNEFAGMLIAVITYSVGVGLLEVVVNPICDIIPKSDKGTGLVLLHSFYCWGQVTLVLVTTLVIKIIGDDLWWILPLFWAIIPTINAIRFAVYKFEETDRSCSESIRSLLSQKGFRLCLVMIVFGCASEQAMSQWAPTFAQTGLGSSQLVGNLLGICMFAVMMGLCRILFSVFGKKLNIKKALCISCICCFACYLAAALCPVPVICLIACAMTGFTVALMCPNILNLSANNFGSGTYVFTLLLAFADIGCMVGPFVTGKITDLIEKSKFALDIAASTGLQVEQVGMRGGILVSSVFPVALFILLLIFKDKNTSRT